LEATVKLIILPLMFSVACIAYQNRDRIADQYNAAYPTNPAKEAAIQHCLAANPNFNRMDADDRQQCYRENLGSTPVAIPVAAAPTPSPYYAYNPSHLAANDIRRQQTNDAYLQATMIQAAAARPVVVVASAYHPAVQAHHTVQAYRSATVAAHTTLVAYSR
jgi:hypothetical protein